MGRFTRGAAHTWAPPSAKETSERRQRRQLGAQKIPIWNSHPLLGEAHASVHIGGDARGREYLG